MYTGEKIVLRLLKKNKGIEDIFDLGFPKDEEILKNSFDKRNSITVIAAPTGEGKTTTLYSILDYLNRPEINVTTIEDPVEIRVEGINQIEIDENTSFASSLRTVLRQDPDIILVGEIRDLETAEIAMQSGQTGRLVRRICPYCSKERDYTEEEKKIITEIGEKYNTKFDLTKKKTFDTCGCEKCNYTGFLGRIAAFEVLNLDDEIKQAIMEEKSTIEIRKIAMTKNYRPLVVDAIKKVIEGYTTLKEVNNKLALY